MNTSTTLRRSPGAAPAAAANAETGQCEFAGLLGQQAWQRLAPPIRRRFAEKPTPGRPIRYCGTMHRVESSAAGWLLAQACRLIGTPFAPHRGAAVPVTITLRCLPDGGIAWEREYHYPRRRAVRVCSTKYSGAAGLEERVTCGLGMRLALFEAQGALHFMSLRYFLQFGRRRIWLPRLLTPGTAHVVHTELGGGRFRFSMSFRHPWLGRLFHQDGVFTRESGVEQ